MINKDKYHSIVDEQDNARRKKCPEEGNVEEKNIDDQKIHL